MYEIGPYWGIILPCLFPCGGPSWGEYRREKQDIDRRFCVQYMLLLHTHTHTHLHTHTHTHEQQNSGHSMCI